MSTLKGILFTQVASEGLNDLISELQNKYKPKKGRRFNYSNITYEISRPALKEGALEFEVSSKIPQDELKEDKDMKTYFQEIKKIVNAESKKPVSIEMENIVWDSKKDSEKERDYVKLLYSYPLDELYNDKQVQEAFEKMRADGGAKTSKGNSGAITPQGDVVLSMVKESIQALGNKHIACLIDANKKVRDSLKN